MKCQFGPFQTAIAPSEFESIECRDEAVEERQRRLKGLSLIAAVAVVLWNVPPPLEISSQAWHLFTIFVSTMSAYRPWLPTAIALPGLD